ncbi:MAG: phosphate acetyltransferase [Phenylobacterium zucineum]|nr:MAG: phosphate acetyltransferase [Phenylobacterium zucineum]
MTRSVRMTAQTDTLLQRRQQLPPSRTAVVHPVKASAITAAAEAQRLGLIVPVLIGPAARVQAAAEEAGVDIGGWERIDVEHSHAAAAEGAALAASGRVEVLMKGSLHSDELLEAVVRPEAGLRTDRRISHAYLMTIASYPTSFIITDAAVNILPDLQAKADIVQNAVDLWRAVFDTAPKVAILAAVEVVNPKMPATLDAAALCKMADRGQITGCLIDGPLAFDNAVSREAAAEKGIVSPVAGAADIMVVPDIEAGNMLAKQLTFLSGAEAAGIVLGARVPIVLTSRADNERSRLLSCALAGLLAAARKAGRIK